MIGYGCFRMAGKLGIVKMLPNGEKRERFTYLPIVIAVFAFVFVFFS